MKFETAHLHSLQERNTEARPRSFDDRGVILEPSAGGGISVDVVSCKLKRAGYNITSIYCQKNHASRYMCNSIKRGIDLVKLIIC